MTRPQWLPNAKAIFAIQSRFISSSTPAPAAAKKNAPGVFRPHLDASSSSFLRLRNRRSEAAKKRIPKNIQDQNKPESAAHHMLVIEGLPTNLRAADFYRLAGREGLSSYANAISNVTQDRDPWTFDPLGIYRVSFSTSAAAALYEAKFERVLRLAQFKMSNSSKGNLWHSQVPRGIRSAIPPAKELADFTILPGSFQGLIRKQRSRVKGKYAWQNVMDKIIEDSIFEFKHGVVLIELEHPTLNTTELKMLIDQDGREQNHHWEVGRPYHIRKTLIADQQLTKNTTRVPLVDDPDFRHKIQTRFILVCESTDVAWRFTRSWNQRILETISRAGVVCRNHVKVSFVEI
ncbi:hypothetical protein NW762_001757 [Fusarium torreyae]|uniref:Uncharacterized protein n=1 Tax=Fusarium torreyae TaxID=1237075 RepID=A0A9W8SDX0_9HYPO|nr:hypothetical protein NW762_001757 [Fusarium torreyae]